MADGRPYHHGDLRRAVLDHATTVVRDRGAADLSLREVAASIGVTHAAPRRYFPNRQELLDALAVEGFSRLGVRLREAAEASGPSHAQRIRALAATYLDFALAEANLVELMFAHKHGAGGGAVSAAAAAAFAPILQVFRDSHDEHARRGRPAERVALLFLADVQGLAGLINCGVVPADHLEDFVDDTVAQFVTR